jgi:uncharacterized membrane protein
MVTWKRDLASGLIVLVPLIVTSYVLLWLYNKIATAAVITDFGENLLEDTALGFAAEFVEVLTTLVVFVLLVLAVGYLMRTAVGSVVESWIDTLMNRIPGLRVVYNASKMASETALTGTESLQKPVKIEPWEGMRLTAFKTGKRSEDGKEMLFMPTSPNITTGYVVEVKEENITETDERVEDALTRLLSAGFGEDKQRQVTLGNLATDDVSDAVDSDDD